MTEDVDAVGTLIFRYAELQDESDLEKVSRLFTYGCFVVDKVGVPACGEGEVLALKRRHLRLYPDGTLRTKHVTTNVVVELGDGPASAAARSYFVVFQATEGFPLQAIMAGRYHDRFHRIDGTWWFKERRVFTDLVGDMSHHVDGDPMGPQVGGAPG